MSCGRIKTGYAQCHTGARWGGGGRGSSSPAVEFRVFKSCNFWGFQLYHLHLTRLAQAEFLNMVSMDNYQGYFETSENVYESRIRMCIFDKKGPASESVPWPTKSQNL